MQEVVIKITNTKWASAEETRQEVKRTGLRWGRLGIWEDMVLRHRWTRNLQTLSVDAVLSVTVGEDLKSLLTGVRQIGQGEDPSIIHLPDEDTRRTIGHRPFRSIVEWKHVLEKGEVQRSWCEDCQGAQRTARRGVG